MKKENSIDPIFKSSLRELKWILVAWFVNFVWVIGYTSRFGYVDEESLSTVWGMPAWTFWGVFFPWILMTIFTIWFALVQMTDHPYDQESSGPSDSALVVGEGGDE